MVFLQKAQVSACTVGFFFFFLKVIVKKKDYLSFVLSFFKTSYFIGACKYG